MAIALLLIVLADLFVVRDFSFGLSRFFGVRFLVNYALALIGLWALMGLVRAWAGGGRAAGRPYKKSLGFLVVFIPMLVETSYFATYKKFVTPFGLGFVTENPGLTLRLYVENFPIVRSVLLFIITAAAFQFLHRDPARSHPLSGVVKAFLLAGILAHGVFGWYTITLFQPSPIAYYTTLLEALARHTRTFKMDKLELPPLARATDAPSVVWVIGESAVLSHMSLYGYPRKTTPCLDSLERAGKLVAFKNAVSVGNKTRLSVPYLLTGLEGPDPQGRFYRRPNIFDYAKAAGYKTAFISAQDFRWGHQDKTLVDEHVDVFKDGSSFSSSVDVLKGADDETLLREGVFPLLSEWGHPFLIVVQLDGSHYPYSRHSPPAFKRFLPEESPNGINAFDNTLVYTDHCLAALFAALEARDPGAWLFYTPDHGQNLGGADGRFNDNFLENVVHNPLVVFPPPGRREALLPQVSAPVSHIDLFATTLDLLGISPARPIDGYSLLRPIPARRLRVCSEYMPTFHNNPTALLIYPDLTRLTINFEKKTVESAGGAQLTRYEALDPAARAYLDARLAAR